MINTRVSNHSNKTAFPALLARISVTIVLALSTGKLSANLLVNGSFETGDFTGWTFSGNVGVLNDGEVTEDGSWAAVFNSANTPPNGIVSQSFVSTPGTQYDLTFYYSLFPTVGNTQSLDLLVTGGTTLANEIATSPPGTSPNTYGFFSYAFTANSGTTTIQFTDDSANDSGDQDGILDNVSVNPVPEPVNTALGGLAFLAIGAGGVRELRRRRLQTAG